MLKPVQYLIYISLALLIFGQAGAAAGQMSSLKTKYLTVMYENIRDLETFDENIDFSSGSDSFSSFFSRDKSSGTGFEKKLTAKLDALIEKVQLILDMRKPIKIIVRIYPDQNALHDVYFNIYKKKKKLRAWYIFEYNTIYINVQDLTAGMLAHESAHAIVDHYLAVRPPRATAEILARYVDSHLNKDAKVYE